MSLSGVDHVQVVVRDLEMARRTWARLGFTATPRGRHLNRGSGNYCLMLREGYIELIGVVDPALPTSNLDTHLAHGPGLIGLAFGAPSGTEAARHLQAAGSIPPGRPGSSGWWS
jgi:catechol 2,3-dioxygenase-like lactoylglutathione lyase family enzyme